MHIFFSSGFNKLFVSAILIFIFIPVSSALPQDSTLHVAGSHEDLVRGERLFHGLVYPGLDGMDCSACHSTFSQASYDSINWNPDALEISLKYLKRTEAELGRVLINPAGEKMAAVHANFNFSEEEIALLKLYMDNFTERGLSQQKLVVTNLLLFILASLLFLGALTDMLITRRLKMQWINMAVLSVTTIYITWVLVINAILIGRSPGYSPDQPIKFSHAVHAGQNGTDCIYCHSYAPISKVSGITPANVCMNCHLLVRNGKRSGMFEIAKVISAYENREPIRWIQIHNLPDHAYYNHSQHVTAGGLDCRECHGEVEKMDRIVQISDLSMGWCVNCHRERNVNFTGNDFYSRYALLADEVRNGTIDSVNVEMIGGNDCMRCHY
jgi:hypothetical protein